MYERFTDRARKALQLANQEAEQFKHEHIGTEHILLGLVKEGSGVAAHVLKNLGIDPRKIHLEVEKLTPSKAGTVAMRHLPQTPHAKNTIKYSLEEAHNLRHNYVGTEHILLGLLREPESLGVQVLTNCGLKLEDVRAHILTLLGCAVPGLSEPDLTERFQLPVRTDKAAKHTAFCPLCGGEKFTWGEARGAYPFRFKPDSSSWLKRRLGLGKTIRARKCDLCGNLQLFVVDS